MDLDISSPSTIYQQSDNRDSTDFECVTCFANKDFYHMLHTILGTAITVSLFFFPIY